jgi:hypothetical protein
VPEGAVRAAVSIDGVLAPIDGGQQPVDVRAGAAREGRIGKGPAGYREVGRATLRAERARRVSLASARWSRCA